LDVRARGRDDFLLDAADREHQAAQADLPGHRGVAPYRAPGEQGDEGHEHGDSSARSILRDRPRRHMDMDIALLEPAGIDAERDRPVLDDAQRGLRALAHDFAELTGQDELAGAGNTRRLDEEDVAPDRRPGETGRY